MSSRKKESFVVYLSSKEQAGLDEALRKNDVDTIAAYDALVQQRRLAGQKARGTRRAAAFVVAILVIAAAVALLVLRPWAPKQLGPCTDDKVDRNRSVEIDKMAPSSIGWLPAGDLLRDDAGNYRLQSSGVVWDGIGPAWEGGDALCVQRVATGYEVWGNPSKAENLTADHPDYPVVKLQSEH